MIPAESPEPGAVVVTEVALADQPPALLLGPAQRRRQPAVLWLHWLGHNRGDRTQFLGEAVTLAQRGVVSLLPQGVFPWLEDPVGTADDLAQVRRQIARSAAALAHLHRRPDVDRDRVAVVSHDYGAMCALNLREDSILGMVCAAPDATWAHWFRTYWLQDADLAPGYDELFGDVDPLRGAAWWQDRLLLQWAEKDEYVDPAVRDRYAAAAPRARATMHERYDHQLGDRARAERLELLTGLLLGPADMLRHGA